MKSEMLIYLFLCLTIVKGTTDENKSVDLLDICTLQPEKGTCRNDFVRYFYNSEYKVCTKFKYTGCGGNPNNFLSREQCSDNCPGKYIRTQKPLYCMNVPDKGECNKSIARYYYYSKRNSCLDFRYSECGGNDNRFLYYSDCVMNCVTHEFSLKLKSK